MNNEALEETESKVQDLLNHLSDAQAQERTIRQEMAGRDMILHAQILELQEEVAGAENRLERARAALEEKCYDLVETEKEIRLACRRIRDEIKREIYSLPAELLGSTRAIVTDDHKVTISKVTTKTEYKVSLLDDFPSLQMAEIDGSPLVMRTIDPVVLERLILRGVINEEVAEHYKVIVKTKNPAVRIA